VEGTLPEASKWCKYNGMDGLSLQQLIASKQIGGLIGTVYNLVHLNFASLLAPLPAAIARYSRHAAHSCAHTRRTVMVAITPGTWLQHRNSQDEHSPTQLLFNQCASDI